MENHEILTPSYEEACKTLKHIIDVDFPTKENITHAFLQHEVLSYMVIGGNYSQEIKSALSIVLREVIKNEQATTKVSPKDNTDHKLLLNYRKKHIISPIIGEIPHNKEKTIENILPIQEEVIIEPKVEKITPIEGKKSDIQNTIQPIIKKEKITINPDTKIWEENMRVIKGVDFTHIDKKISLSILHNIIEKYLGKNENKLFIEQYTKPDPQNKDSIIYRIQAINVDIANKNHKKTVIQNIIIEIEKILHIE